MVVLVYFFYFWDKDKSGGHLIASFEQFISSSHSSVIISAVEKAVQSCGDNKDSLCKTLIEIVLKNPMGNIHTWLVNLILIHALQSILL